MCIKVKLVKLFFIYIIFMIVRDILRTSTFQVFVFGPLDLILALNYDIYIYIYIYIYRSSRQVLIYVCMLC